MLEALAVRPVGSLMKISQGKNAKGRITAAVYENRKNSFRISKAYADANFGMVVINWQAQPSPQVTLKAIGLDGKLVFEHQIRLNELQVRSE